MAAPCVRVFRSSVDGVRTSPVIPELFDREHIRQGTDAVQRLSANIWRPLFHFVRFNAPGPSRRSHNAVLGTATNPLPGFLLRVCSGLFGRVCDHPMVPLPSVRERFCSIRSENIQFMVGASATTLLI